MSGMVYSNKDIYSDHFRHDILINAFFMRELYVDESASNGGLSEKFEQKSRTGNSSKNLEREIRAKISSGKFEQKSRSDLQSYKLLRRIYKRITTTTRVKISSENLE